MVPTVRSFGTEVCAYTRPRKKPNGETQHGMMMESIGTGSKEYRKRYYQDFWKSGHVYKKDVEPNLKPGAALAFAHGFNIHYGYIILPLTVVFSL